MKKILITACLLLAVTGCRKIDLYHDLSEEEANEMLVVLQQEGIATSKAKEVRQNEIFWTVQVDPKRLIDARRLLVEHNLPRKKELGLSGVYKEKGLIPTPDEQKARYLLALKGEIINSLIKIPEVIDVDVVMNIPSPEEFANKAAQEKRPTASVVIKAKPTEMAESVLSESKIQQFVANSVEGLNPRDVSVIITYLSSPKKGLLPGQSLILPSASDTSKRSEGGLEKATTRIAGLDVAAGSQKRLRIYLVIFFLLLAVLAVNLIVTVISTNRMRRQLSELKGEGGGVPLIEGKVVEERSKLPPKAT